MNAVKLLTAALLAAMSTAATAGTFTTIYTFPGGAAPSSPSGPLVYQNGALYGTTAGGGTHGSLFKLDIDTRVLTDIYDFMGGSDGALPKYIIYHDGMFYGATYYGGNSDCNRDGCGTVFSFDPSSGVETVLYRFPDPKTGRTADPGGLVYQDGSLYGTAYNGGSFGYGSVFAINLQTGVETDLHSFSYDGDGFDPVATLLYRNGLLYGVTTYGGNPCVSHECGIIFSVDPTTGAEETLHTFGPGIGGNFPRGNLIERNGLIYGSTLLGGDLSCGKGGCGTVFSIDPATGAYNVVETPTTNHERVNALATHGNKLYETVLPPNGHRNLLDEGELASFNLKSGKRTLLYNFDHGRAGADGSQPYAPLVYAHGVFYGSTNTGGGTGCNNQGCGTLFQYVP